MSVLFHFVTQELRVAHLALSSNSVMSVLFPFVTQELRVSVEEP